MGTMVWVSGGVFLAGMALVGGSLWLDGKRRQRFRRGSAESVSEVVRVEEIFQVGRNVEVALGGAEAVAVSLFVATVHSVEERTITLALERTEFAAKPQKASPTFPLGASLHVTFNGPGGLYRFTTSICDARADSRNASLLLLTIPRPEWMERNQRRSYSRVRLDLPATAERAHVQPGPDASEAKSPRSIGAAAQPQHGTILDLSCGGLCLEMGSGLGAHKAGELLDAFTPGTIVKVRVSLPGFPQSHLLANVRTSRRTATRGGLGIRLTCEFLPMSDAEQQSLMAYIASAQ